MAVYGPNILISGGINDQCKTINDLNLYSLVDQTWRDIEVSNPLPPLSRAAAVGVWYEGRFVDRTK